MKVQDASYYEVVQTASLAEKLAIAARKRIYDKFIECCQPQAVDKILDIGVSDVAHDIANIFERRYPHLAQVTAVGLGEGHSFRADYPAVTYRQITPHTDLPFTNQSFDHVISNAVLEHLGSAEKQKHFIAEHIRLGRQVFITVPNRFFPVEHHTAIPFMHYNDATFKLACRLLGKTAWLQQENLILMTQRKLAALVPVGSNYTIGTTGIALGSFSSNLYLHIKN